MTMRGMYLIGMLVVLFLANVAMLMGLTNWPQRVREGFAAAMAAGGAKKSGVEKFMNPSPLMAGGAGSGVVAMSGVAAEAMDNIAPYSGLKWGAGNARQGVAGGMAGGTASVANREFFEDYLTKEGGSAFATAPIGSYDGVNLAANLPPAAQGFRARMPDVPLAGPPVEVGPDNLFIFKNNVCDPSCCGATLSCDGGCVCTTPEQRRYIGGERGGNRLHGGDF